LVSDGPSLVTSTPACLQHPEHCGCFFARKRSRGEDRAELLHLAEEVFHRRAGCLRDTHQVAQQLVGSLERDVELRHLCVKSRHRGAHVHISDAGEVEEQARSRLELVAGRPEERIDVCYRTSDHLGRLRDRA